MPACHVQNNQGIQMSYLKDFLKHISNHDYPAFLKLWEEYCSSDELEGPELVEILKAVKGSSFAEFFGKHVERALPLWEKIQDPTSSHEAFKLIIDLETTNNPKIGEKVYNYLQSKFGNEKYFNEKIRLIGLRSKDKFQNAVSNYELLSHINKGKFVFHTAGWGVGEIVDYSLIREQLSLEFDYVAGKKDLPFHTAFKTLIPIPDDHFLALRFGSPDLLEQKAKEDPVEVIRMLLRDLGPRSASEIKDELCELVIPADEWTKWWQNARSKIKKDTMIETPDDIRKPFRLRQTEISHEERLQKVLENKPDANTLIQMIYSFMKDFPEILKNPQFKTNLSAKLEEMLVYPEITKPQKLQIYFFLQDLGLQKQEAHMEELLKHFSSIPAVQELIDHIQVLSFKKRALVEIRQVQTDWKSIFLSLLLSIDQSTLRDYILSELLSEKAEEEVKKRLEELCAHPAQYPDTFVWYFQKIMAQKKMPFSDKQGKVRFFESFLILLSHLEQVSEQRDLIKKMHSILSAGRYAIVRQMMQDAHVDEVKEFLLLATKCHSLSDHDIKILHSLAEVAHPSLGKLRKKGKDSSAEEPQIIWTTQEGYLKLQQRIQQIATVETVENAKEIEIARAHGDLRENAEFKAALERRDRLQAELKFLSDQLNRTRIITKQDISTDEVGVGSIVQCVNQKGQPIHYTLLGPWDADPEKNILSFQSKLAQTMKGLSIGDKFQFQGDSFTISGISSYL
jgi:transcription elongation factor GreA-like protein/transcription elongation GreA/GreB family factor